MSTTWAIFSALLLSGTYVPVEGNSPDLCPQRVRAHVWDEVLTGLTVTYVGDCYADGPYVYGCDENGLCGDSTIDIEILDSGRYRWTNRAYGFTGVFQRESTRAAVPENP